MSKVNSQGQYAMISALLNADSPVARADLRGLLGLLHDFARPI